MVAAIIIIIIIIIIVIIIIISVVVAAVVMGVRLCRCCLQRSKPHARRRRGRRRSWSGTRKRC